MGSLSELHLFTVRRRAEQPETLSFSITTAQAFDDSRQHDHLLRGIRQAHDFQVWVFLPFGSLVR